MESCSSHKTTRSKMSCLMEVRRFMLLSAALQLFPRLAFCKPRWIPSWVHCRQPEAGPQGQILK